MDDGIYSTQGESDSVQLVSKCLLVAVAEVPLLQKQVEELKESNMKLMEVSQK